jgi:transcription initiation factor IIF auxiliary subunit
MTLLPVQQEAHYAGDRYWNWSVWLQGPAPDLDQVNYVEYTLDRTFPSPVRRVRDRNSNFRLSAGGWGEFVIYVKIVFRDGSSSSLDHRLRLEHPVEEATPRPV